jgi:hypothetical protein
MFLSELLPKLDIAALDPMLRTVLLCLKELGSRPVWIGAMSGELEDVAPVLQVWRSTMVPAWRHSLPIELILEPRSEVILELWSETASIYIEFTGLSVPPDVWDKLVPTGLPIGFNTDLKLQDHITLQELFPPNQLVQRDLVLLRLFNFMEQ